jgi:hypothetical protein
LGAPESVDFHWMTGGENRPDAWMLKTEKLKPGKAREFDSYDPMGGNPEGNFIGDGVLVRVLRNDQQVWPAGKWGRTNWEFLPNATVTKPLDTTVEVGAGDKLIFILNRYASDTGRPSFDPAMFYAIGNAIADTTTFDPTIVYADGETHVASKEFSNEQGRNGWWYQYREGGKLLDLDYCVATGQWRKPGDNQSDAMFIGPGEMHPGSRQDAARVWIAPKAGKIRLTSTLVNIGNPPMPNVGRSFRMGSGTYAPWNALLNRVNGDGLFLGWDYFGHWASAFRESSDGSVDVQFRVAGHDQTLAPGQSLTAPKAFSGLFMNDLDEAGNACLDWQYQYLWDYTRDRWFPATRQAGWWWKGSTWWDVWNFGVEGPADQDSVYRKIFRMADVISEIGADVYHRDWGWWDRTGDWNGPDFSSTRIYLAKHNMGQLIYSPVYHVDAKSQVALQHPEWVVDGRLDMSRPDVIEYLKGRLDNFAERFGAFEWKNDGIITVPRNSDLPLLGQDQGFRELLRYFLDKHPDCSFLSCDGGGNYAGYDYVRYSTEFTLNDGSVGFRRNYWASLILPPDKTCENGDGWELGRYDKAFYRGLLCINFDNAGDTWEPDKLEGMRELIDIYHYLLSQGVVGRWVHVFRPVIAGDDPLMYFERLSRDGRRGILIPKRPASGPVTIRPKGLNAAGNYQVSFQESEASETRTGADLMEKGIRLECMNPGELIYLNLPFHPGNKLDKTPPAPPQEARKIIAANMGYPGVEVSWKAGHDDHWVSYYEVLRDGAVLDKVAKGTYYFDHSAGADLAAKYEVRIVNEAGLRSGLVLAGGPSGQRALVIDDATEGGGLRYTGHWDRQTNLQPAYAGTISGSNEKGATFTVQFTGKKFTWFTKLGDDGGKAQAEADGKPDAIVDTYSADDIWGVGIYTKEFPEGGAHSVKVTVLGERGGPPQYGKGIAVYLDGVRIER